MTDKKSNPRCLACGRGPDEAPLIPLAYRPGEYWICPQDLPVLIHNPAQLADRLPGAEHLKPSPNKP